MHENSGPIYGVSFSRKDRANSGPNLAFPSGSAIIGEEDAQDVRAFYPEFPTQAKKEK